MANAAFEDLVETFEFLDDWEDRYRHVIDLGKAMPVMDAALQVPANKVDGCASQVWLHIQPEGELFKFQGASDAMIVSGLIAILKLLYNDVPISDVAAIDAPKELARLGLQDHLSAQRSNGLRAMVARLGERSANL